MASVAPSLEVTGSMTYPEADLKYRWDGRGTAGPAATCSISNIEIVLSPRKVFRRFLGWPDLVIPVHEVTAVDRLLFGRYRFGSSNRRIDGACFRPISGRDSFARALESAGLSIVESSRQRKLRWEARMLWNQVRWGGRSRSRHG